MGTDPSAPPPPESRLVEPTTSDSLLLQLRSDRRLGHEWDDWDGDPLPRDGVFTAPDTLFFTLLLALVGGFTVVAAVGLWLIAPRLTGLWAPLPAVLWSALAALPILAVLWTGAVLSVTRSGRNWLPGRLAEGGLVPWLMPKIEWGAVRAGLSRDRAGNAAIQVFNRLSAARARAPLSPDELLVLLPRCLGKEAMRAAMDVAERYGVPMFVASRGRYARQMIAMRRPKAIIAVACERDLVSGIHDVAGKLPVLGTTLALGEGPCRNTTFSVDQLEQQVRQTMGLDRAHAAPAPLA